MRSAVSRRLRQWTYGLVGREISRLARYADRIVHVDPLPSDGGFLMDAIVGPEKSVASSARLDDAAIDPSAVAVVLLVISFILLIAINLLERWASRFQS